MNSDRLLKARAYEERMEEEIGRDERPAFHLSARVGWMNDPNGFGFYQGKYHLFYQYNPYHTHWGPMHWAHAVSEDLLNWETLPAALAPDEEYDRNGCFSGSAAETADGKHLLMYTGVRIEEYEDGSREEFQTQCLAVGDGVDYEKYAGNPVLSGKDLPEGAYLRDFRDPRIWRREDGSYRSVVGSRPADGSGQILLYGSENGFDWSFMKVLAENRNRYGKMWECPDFFFLDGKGVLMVSPQDMLRVEGKFHSGSGNLCIIGDWDHETETFTEEHVQVIDDGVDYYAMQTACAPDGRRIMIAWMQNWDTQEHALNEKWFGQMSLPREISVRNGRLIQQPVREIEKLRVKTVSHADVKVAEKTQLDGVCGRYADMEVTVRPDENGLYERFTLTLAGNEQFDTKLVFEPAKGLLTMDRSNCGTRHAFAHRRHCRVGCEDGVIRLRVILDRNSIEVFVGEGEKTMTMLIPTELSANAMSFEAEGGAVVGVTLHELAH